LGSDIRDWIWVIRMIRKWSALLGAFSLICLTVDLGCANELRGATAPALFTKSLELFNSGQCQEAWNEMWKLAAAGDYYALYILAGQVVLAHPYKFSRVTQVEFRKILIPMAFYATLAPGTDDQPFSANDIRKKFIPAFLEASDADINQLNRRMVLDCFKSKASSGACVNLAVENHVIPAYDDYIATVTEMNQTRLQVTCNGSGGEAPPHEQPTEK
jgi:hypothetical protein